MNQLFTIHYDVIGSIPKVEYLRDRLPQLIERYRSTDPLASSVIEVVHFKVQTVGLKAASDFLLEISKDPVHADRIACGALIALAAMHFYGLKDEDFDTPSELMDAILALDSELEHS